MTACWGGRDETPSSQGQLSSYKNGRLWDKRTIYAGQFAWKGEEDGEDGSWLDKEAEAKPSLQPGPIELRYKPSVVVR